MKRNTLVWVAEQFDRFAEKRRTYAYPILFNPAGNEHLRY